MAMSKYKKQLAPQASLKPHPNLPQVNVILGSLRTDSAGRGLYKYLKSQQAAFEAQFQIKLKFMQLGDYPLPAFNLPYPPQSGLNPTPQNKIIQTWLQDLKKGHGYLFLEPIYDYSIPGAFKNALDYVGFEMQNKPVRLITYSQGPFGGNLAPLALFPIFSILGLITLPKVTTIREIQKNWDPAGHFLPTAPSKTHYINALKLAFQDIAQYTKALQNLI